MADSDTVRRLAMALPEVVEQPHHGFPSFRVAGKILATLPDPEHVHLMLDEDAIREAVAVAPAACEEKWWGARLAALRVNLAAVGDDVLEQLLAEAWRRRAPRSLLER